MSNKLIHRTRDVDKRIIKKIGLYPAILLSELIDKESHCLDSGLIDDDGYFYHKKDHIYIRSSLKRRGIEKALKELEENGIVKTKKGKGNKIYFKIPEENFSQLLYPNAKEVISKKTALEDMTIEGYIKLHISLSHKVGIDEAITLSALASKRNYFSKRGELVNGSFFSSVSDLENDTTFTKKQQKRIIDSLVKQNLVFVQVVNNNTRYFSLNISLIEDYKKFDYSALINTESTNSNSSESTNSNTTKIEIINPFLNTESTNSNSSESTNSNTLESIDSNAQNVEKVTGKVTKKGPLNCSKGNTNNNQVIITKNKNKTKIELLLKNYFESTELINAFLEVYTEERIIEVIHECEKVNRDNPSGFIRTALKENYNFKSSTSSINNKVKLSKKLEKESDDKYKNDLNKKIHNDNLTDQWIKDNPKKYKEVYKLNEKLFLEKTKIKYKDPSYMINVQTRIYIKNEILGM